MKQSGDTMDRPRSVSGHEILSGSLRVLLTPKGDRIRRLRRWAQHKHWGVTAHRICRALHTFLSPKVCETYKPMQTRMAKTYILDCYEKPHEHIDHAKKYVPSSWFPASDVEYPPSQICRQRGYHHDLRQDDAYFILRSGGAVHAPLPSSSRCCIAPGSSYYRYIPVPSVYSRLYYAAASRPSRRTRAISGRSSEGQG